MTAWEAPARDDDEAGVGEAPDREGDLEVDDGDDRADDEDRHPRIEAMTGISDAR